MGRSIHNDYNQYVAPSSSTTLHSGAGWIRSILITGVSTTTGNVTIYDNTAASGNVLAVVSVVIGAPVIVVLPLQTPLRFHTGLTVVTDANARAFFLTES